MKSVKKASHTWIYTHFFFRKCFHLRELYLREKIIVEFYDSKEETLRERSKICHSIVTLTVLTPEHGGNRAELVRYRKIDRGNYLWRLMEILC